MPLPTFSVCVMIGRDESFVYECLTSALSIANEYVLVYDKLKIDNVSISNVKNFVKDNPKAIVKEFYREWDTGTKQKQFMIEQATKDYVLCLDADEILSDNCIELKSVVVEADKKGIDAFSILGHC